MESFATDELLGAFVPIIVYWIYAGFYTVMEYSSEKYRLHTRGDEEDKNLVTKRDVVKGVLLQQAVQAIVALVMFRLTKEEDNNKEKLQHSFPTILVQVLIAMIALDTWQYFVHRYMHINKLLYKYIHSKHHAIVIPYAIGAMYNHPAEGFIMDTIGGVVSFLVSGMSPHTGIFFFSFATIKTVDDHCGLCLPWNPFHMLFANNSAYHDIHHQRYGSKYNFSQPFFVAWDKTLATYMPPTYTPEERMGSGDLKHGQHIRLKLMID